MHSEDSIIREALRFLNIPDFGAEGIDTQRATDICRGSLTTVQAMVEGSRQWWQLTRVIQVSTQADPFGDSFSDAFAQPGGNTVSSPPSRPRPSGLPEGGTWETGDTSGTTLPFGLTIQSEFGRQSSNPSYGKTTLLVVPPGDLVELGNIRNPYAVTVDNPEGILQPHWTGDGYRVLHLPPPYWMTYRGKIDFKNTTDLMIRYVAAELAAFVSHQMRQYDGVNIDMIQEARDRIRAMAISQDIHYAPQADAVTNAPSLAGAPVEWRFGRGASRRGSPYGDSVLRYY